jgi:hypothetical protein
MQFEHAVQAQTYEQVKEYLGELFEEPVHDERDGHIYVRYGSTVLEIAVDAHGPEEAAVTITSYCVQGVSVDEELLLGLLELNHRQPFGAFSLVGSDIYYSYSLFGRTMNRRSLLGALEAVATVADDYDDRIVARYGGHTALEKIRDTGGKRERTGEIRVRRPGGPIRE